MSRHIQEWTFNFQSDIYTVRGGFKLSTISYRNILGCLDIERVVQLEEVVVIT